MLTVGAAVKTGLDNRGRARRRDGLLPATEERDHGAGPKSCSLRMTQSPAPPAPDGSTR
jgi:hypothetical protein